MDSLAYPNFYPYVPNEVKHRKRTSTAQLRVLEATFEKDTKPNAALRKTLAHDLDMTPRGVQVWFQNRRAKEKNKASKAAEAIKRRDGSYLASPTLADASSSPELAYASEDTSPDNRSSHSQSPPTWNVTPSTTPVSSDLDSVQFPPRIDPYLMRRGSLPVDLHLQPSPSYHTPLSDHANEFARRCSVDTSLQMLARNPYANLASRRAPAMYQMAGFSSRSHQRSSPSSFELGHVSMDPHAMYYHDSSSSSSQNSFSHSPSPHSPFGSLPDANCYSAPSRVVPPAIPGPLPAEGFIFGAASHDNVYGTNGDFTDVDDTASSSYDTLSRFGSITSVATTDSSVYFSECGDDTYLEQASRRGSASGINDLMSTMSFHHNASIPVIAANEEAVSNSGGSRDGSDRTSKYPSPAPTVSPPGASPVAAGVEPRLDLVYPASYVEGTIDTHSSLAHAVYNPQSHTGPSSSLDLPLQFSHAVEYHPKVPISSTGHYQDPNTHYDNSGSLTGGYPFMHPVQGEYHQSVQVPVHVGGYSTGEQAFV